MSDTMIQEFLQNTPEPSDEEEFEMRAAIVELIRAGLVGFKIEPDGPHIYTIDAN